MDAAENQSRSDRKKIGPALDSAGPADKVMLEYTDWDCKC